MRLCIHIRFFSFFFLTTFLGEIRNDESGSCLDTFGRHSGENVGFTGCHGLGGNQVFAYTKNQQIMSDDNCMDAQVPAQLLSQLKGNSSARRQLSLRLGSARLADRLTRRLNAVQVKLLRCHNMAGNQAWRYDSEAKQLVHVNSGLCLNRAPEGRDPTLPVLTVCDPDQSSMRWSLKSNFKWQANSSKDSPGSGNELDD
jgi:polypeptide N-acetylgalactosaminyltransferase